jgi:hypothetical protein
MELAGVLVAPVSVSVALRRIRGRDGELGRYLIERMLR